MKPLAPIQQVMTWLCMCPPDESISKTRRMCYAVFIFFVFTLNCCAALTSVSFIIKYLSSDFEGCLYAVFQIGAFAPMINVIIAALINRHRIAAIFTELAGIYTANKNEATFPLLTEANNKSAWLWDMYLKYGIIGFFVNVLVSTVGSIIYSFYKYGVLNVEHLYKPHKLLMPWNQHTSTGYFSEVFFSTVSVESYFICNGIVLVLFISICWHHQTFYKRFRHTASKLDNKPKANGTLYDLLQFHITVKDWFLKSADVYSHFVLIQLIYHVIFMAAVVFELDMRVKQSFDFQIFLLLNAFPVGIGVLYLYCYFGKLATESYEKMAKCLYESSWYEMPQDLQKNALFMIQNMQKPVFYNGFGVAVLNLETFVKFIRTIFTMYMMFRTLSSA